jgi:hypothetical protein
MFISTVGPSPSAAHAPPRACRTVSPTQVPRANSLAPDLLRGAHRPEGAGDPLGARVDVVEEGGRHALT